MSICLSVRPSVYLSGTLWGESMIFLAPHQINNFITFFVRLFVSVIASLLMDLLVLVKIQRYFHSTYTNFGQVHFINYCLIPIFMIYLFSSKAALDLARLIINCYISKDTARLSVTDLFCYCI